MLINYFYFLLSFYHGPSNNLSDSGSAPSFREAINKDVHYCEGSKFMGMVNPRITIKQGVLEGSIKVTKTGFEYKSFQGIPYARPPIGELRFRDPQEAGKWEGILNATEVGSACTQYDPLITHRYYGQEDCLFLNVYVPKTDDNYGPFPVMVWIFGGGFVVGDGSPEIYGPDYLVEKNVIVVTVNYRLGVFGFLSLNTPEVPGNAGLKDQSLALKWVKENIGHFNGDNNKITIFGISSGAASVHYHTLSPMSRGLFHRAIIESGAANCIWALQKDPQSLAFKLAEEIGFKTDSKDEVVAFLRTISNVNLTYAALSPNFVGKIRLSWAPSTEKLFPNTESFITRTPQELLRSGDFQKVPILMGVVTKEGLILETGPYHVPADLDAIKNNSVPDLKLFVPDELIAKYGENGVDAIMTKIQQFYFPPSGNKSEGLIKLYSDFAFIKDIVAAITASADRSSTVYYYEFAYIGSRNFFKFLTGFNYTGTAHTDELGYLFDISHLGIDQIPPTESDLLVTERMVTLWTNFAKYGNPTPRKTDILPIIWKPVKHSNVVCLHIDEQLKMIGNPYAEVVQFWNNINKM